MGSCIICGKSVDGATCSSHEEDVAFEFRGTRPDQLVPGRYYRGEVDGFADFGVFVNVGDRVTGLLHESEIDGRLENLGWDVDDEAYVKVTNVHDNGNVDLSWSIRQSEREFRGTVVHDPSADRPEVADEGNGQTAETDAANETRTGESDTPDAAASSDQTETRSERETETESGNEAESERRSEPETPTDVSRVPVGDLGDHVGDAVRLEGEVASVHQTGGPTIFGLGDETGRVDCAAFKAAGERAYPDVDVDDVVALTGLVERRHGDLQVETESMTVLDGDDREEIRDRLEAALAEQAAPPETEPIADEPGVTDAQDAAVDAATAIRRAVVESRPVVVRHTATLDGYVGGAAIERAVLPLVRERHAESDAEYHYVTRRPLDDEFYDMKAATDDVTDLLENAARHDEPHPLVVLVDAGGTRESADGLEFLATYDVSTVVVSGGEGDAAVAETVDEFCGGDDRTTSTALAANVAAAVNPDVRDGLGHLPAVSYWEDTPESYADLAADAGYDDASLADVREAIALVAYYQSYEPKREIVEDLLWGGPNHSFAGHASAQFRTKLDDEVEAAETHLDARETGDAHVGVLDAAAFTHRFEFPPTGLVLDALHRRERRAHEGTVVTVGVDEDELRIRSTSPLSLRAVGEGIADRVENAGVEVRGARDGRIEFLPGERDAVVDATVDVVAEQVDAASAATDEQSQSAAAGRED